MENRPHEKYDEYNLIKDTFLRYFSYWPIILCTCIFMTISSYLYLRYSDYYYETIGKIEIIDKAQDSEMSLPTAMTIFNRSMINLENEIGVLSSYSLHEKAVKALNSNVRFYSVGNLKKTENHYSEWFENYNFSFNDKIKIKNTLSYKVYIDKNERLVVERIIDDTVVEEYLFNNLSTKSKENDLPFELTIFDYDKNNSDKLLVISPLEKTVDSYRKRVVINKVGQISDQLALKLKHVNKKIAEDYINTIINEFDKDGIEDRQFEYKRTIDFVDSRSDILAKELEVIESKKQKFKEINNLANLQEDASINISQKLAYDSELFKTQSQKDLILFIEAELDGNTFKLMPVNIGINNANINNLINEYNFLIKERARYISNGLGPNNLYLKNLEKQILDSYNNISTSISNYEQSLDLTIKNLKLKEKEFSTNYSDIPENEKILRDIERELNIKESLFLLLLQKREEASINYAVIKPSLKVVDSARSSNIPVSPNSFTTHIIFILGGGIFIPIFILYLFFKFDTKIHTRKDLSSQVPDIPVIGEIPFIKKDDIGLISDENSRLPLAESIRMLIANLSFSLYDDKKEGKKNIILVTSSIKGEGKTVVSINTAAMLAAKFDKVLLLGADLRNPQIHKFLNKDKNTAGLSDYIYTDSADWKKSLIKNNNLDILLSGIIPPDPSKLLASIKFKNFIDEVRDIYDYVVIDSAPCLLVSDTFEISKYVDTTLYVVRSNYSQNNLCDFINECNSKEKLSNINLVLNSIGSSSRYGYKYNYQYGYKYGYTYNYGYGYGYSEENKK